MKFKVLVIILITSFFRLSLAADKVSTSVSNDPLVKEFDDFQTDRELLKQGLALKPNTRIEAVHGRIVPRTKRHEVSLEYTAVVDGESYLSTNYKALNYQYHFNPHWSLGGKYASADNKLSAEGDNLIDQFGYLPELDWPEENLLILGRFYPFYGKLNLFDFAIVQFDIYASAGLGQIKLKSGYKGTYAYGVGIGIWVHKNVSIHYDLTQQIYDSERYTGKKEVQSVNSAISIGVIL